MITFVEANCAKFGMDIIVGSANDGIGSKRLVVSSGSARLSRRGRRAIFGGSRGSRRHVEVSAEEGTRGDDIASTFIRQIRIRLQLRSGRRVRARVFAP